MTSIPHRATPSLRLPYLGRVVPEALPGLPIAEASAFEPGGRRTKWMGTITCPECGCGHSLRADDRLGLAGRRRLRCGHGPVIVRIRRTYWIRSVVADA